MISIGPEKMAKRMNMNSDKSEYSINHAANFSSIVFSPKNGSKPHELKPSNKLGMRERKRVQEKKIS